MKTKTVKLLVSVQAPVKLSASRVAHLIGQCIDIGMHDAAETVNDPDLDNPEAALCLNLHINEVEVIR